MVAGQRMVSIATRESSILRVTGPTSTGATLTRGLVLESTSSNLASAICQDSLIIAKNGGGATYGVYCNTGGAGSISLWIFNTDITALDSGNYTVAGLCAAGNVANIYMFGGSIRTSNGNGTDIAVQNTGSGVIVLVGVDYDRTKTS